MAQDDTRTSGSCSAGDPLDVTRSIIDHDIAQQEENIRALKSRRNELSPISCLPAEILCKIFSLSILRSPESWSPVSWTNFSQASQYWRSVALSAPELWTNIPFSYPRWAQEMLIRSKMANLTIRHSFKTSEPKTIETMRSCLYEMNRVEEIDIVAMIPGFVSEEIFRNLPNSKSAPQLRTLRIESCSSEIAFSIHRDFLYDAERLQHVELINCQISWDSRLLTGLTRLTLEGENSSEANSSMNQFLHALQRMPALTELRLKDSIPDDSLAECPSTYPDVDLPCLRMLNISSGVGALTVVLRHITIPHSAILKLTCKENQSIQIDFSNFLSVLSTKFLSSLVFQSLALQILDCTRSRQTHGLQFYLWTTKVFSSSLPETQVELALTWPSPQRHNHVKAFTCAFDAMGLTFLTDLYVTTFDYIDSQTWVKTFGSLPLLGRVYVHSSAAHRFLEALVYKTEAADNFSFPKLSYLYLETPDLGATSVDMLLDCLMERCEGNALQGLYLDGCYDISPNDIERLKEIVVVVVRLESGEVCDSDEDSF